MFALLIASSILGIMLFVSLVMLPIAFGTLTREMAGNFVRKLFPIYHIVLFLASQVAGLLAFTPHLKPIAFLCGLIFALHFVFLTPAVNKASDAGNTNRFKTLHRLSVLVNVIVMALYAFALCVDACFF
jgi:Domain of unknown function (DUF4149)